MNDDPLCSFIKQEWEEEEFCHLKMCILSSLFLLAETDPFRVVAAIPSATVHANRSTDLSPSCEGWRSATSCWSGNTGVSNRITSGAVTSFHYRGYQL